MYRISRNFSTKYLPVNIIFYQNNIIVHKECAKTRTVRYIRRVRSLGIAVSASRWSLWGVRAVVQSIGRPFGSDKHCNRRFCRTRRQQLQYHNRGSVYARRDQTSDTGTEVGIFASNAHINIVIVVCITV